MIVVAATSADPLQVLITSGGIVGAFFVLALLGWIELKPAINRRDDQEKRQQALIDTLLAVYHHEVLPTLGDYEKRLSPILQRNEKLLNEVEWMLGQLERRRSGPEESGAGGYSPEDSFRGRIREGPSSVNYPPSSPRLRQPGESDRPPGPSG